MTHAELLSLQDDQPALVKAITSAAKFGGSIELRLHKLELGQVARKMGVKTVKVDGYVRDRYTLDFTYMEVNVRLYTLVPKQ